MGSFDMRHHIALARMGAVWGRHASEKSEAGDFCRELSQLFDAHKVYVVIDAVNQVNGVRASFLGDPPEHGEERGEAGAASKQEQRAPDLPQIEAAGRAAELDRGPEDSPLVKIGV